MPEATQSAVEAKKRVRRSPSSSPFLRSCWRWPKPAPRTPSICRQKKISSSSDLFNFYQAKRIRSTVVETAAAALEAQKSAVIDPKAQEAFEKQIADFKATVADTRRTRRSRKTAWRRSRIGPRRPRKLGNWPIAGLGITNWERPDPDRHRSGVGCDHHRDHRPCLAQRRAWRDRRGADRVRLFRPGRVVVHRLARIALKAASVRSPDRRSRSPAR